MIKDLFPGVWHAPNLHPLFVHLPLVMVPIALMLLVWGAWKTQDTPYRYGRWALYLGFSGMILAALSGLSAAEDMGHDAPGHDLVHVHRDIMYVTLGIGVLAVLSAFITRKADSLKSKSIVVGLVVAMNVALVFGADRGAELVFRYSIGTAGEEPPQSDHSHREQDSHDHEH